MAEKKKQSSTRYWLTLSVCVALSLFIAAQSNQFLSLGNLLMIIDHSSVLGFLALGVTFIIIAGELDLAFANLTGLICVISALVHLRWNLPVAYALLLSLLAGALAYAVFGYLVSYRGHPGVVLSIAFSNIFLGLNYSVSGARPIYGRMSEAFIWIGQGRVLGIPFTVILFLLAYALAYLLLNKTVGGLYLIAVGDNPRASWICGINSRLIKFFAFVICGVCTAVAGVVITGQLESGQPVVGPPFLLKTLAAVFFGKSISYKNQATIEGTAQGVLLLSLLFNGVNLLGYPSYVEQLVVGGVLIISLLFEHFDTIMKWLRLLDWGAAPKGQVSK